MKTQCAVCQSDLRAEIAVPARGGVGETWGIHSEEIDAYLVGQGVYRGKAVMALWCPKCGIKYEHRAE